MDVLVAPNHKDTILTALSAVPIATTAQLATLNQSLDPNKKASALLRELARDGLVQEIGYHGKEKLWGLSRAGRKQTGSTLTRSNDLAHMLAVGNLWFTTRPQRWLYEPRERFGSWVWKPDCVLVHQRKVYAVEVQLTPRGVGRWKQKWAVYNRFFNEGHFERARFQEWAPGRVIMPQIMVITRQQTETVRQGYAVHSRELIVVKAL